MKYTIKFKLECIQKYRKGLWMNTPEGVSQQGFRDNIKYWDKRERAAGKRGLQDKSTQNKWTLSQKKAIIEDLQKSGVSMNEYAIIHALNSSTLGRWLRAYNTHGIDGLKWLDRRVKIPSVKTMTNSKKNHEKDFNKMTDKEKIKALTKEIKRQKKIIEERDTEIAFIKKLQALIKS